MPSYGNPVDLIGSEWRQATGEDTAVHRVLWTRENQNSGLMEVALKSVPQMDAVGIGIHWVDPEKLIDGSIGWFPEDAAARHFKGQARDNRGYEEVTLVFDASTKLMGVLDPGNNSVKLDGVESLGEHGAPGSWRVTVKARVMREPPE